VTDPSGVYIHKLSCGQLLSAAAWGRLRAGGGTINIDPQNLYTHFKPLSQVLAGIPLKDGQL